MSEIINCPSGLTGRIRGMKVREERILSDRKLAKSGGQVDELLAACWEETLDAGPYDFGDKVIDWGQVLQGDRFFALLQIRALTYGPEYAFAVNCGSDGCRTRIEWEINLPEPISQTKQGLLHRVKYPVLRKEAQQLRGRPARLSGGCRCAIWQGPGQTGPCRR